MMVTNYFGVFTIFLVFGCLVGVLCATAGYEHATKQHQENLRRMNRLNDSWRKEVLGQ